MEAIVNFETECFEENRKHTFSLQFYIFKQEGRYIAYCPALDMTSSGEDLNDAVKQFYEHFQLYVEFCIEEGTLMDDLKAHGWKIDGVKLYQPTFNDLLKKPDFRELLESDTEYERVNAPLEIISCQS